MDDMRALVIMAFCLTAASLCASDIRTINGTAVDLQPIHDWKNANGKPEERPMKHWKEIRLVELYQVYSPQLCIASVRVDGSVQKVTIKNLPADLVAKVNKLQSLRAQLAGAEHGTAVAKANAAAAGKSSGGVYYVSGNNTDVNALLAEQRRKANVAAAATANAEMATSSLQSLKEEITKLTREIDNQPLLAMAVGSVYMGSPLWDTGLKR